MDGSVAPTGQGVPTGFLPAPPDGRNDPIRSVSVESIRDYVDHRMQEMDARIGQRATFNERSSDEKWEANENRLNGMNEIREAMKDQSSRTPSRDEMGALANTLRSERQAMILPMQDKLDAMGKPNYALVASALSIIGLLVGGFWAIITLKVEAQSGPLSTKIETANVDRASLAERLKSVEINSNLSTGENGVSRTDRLQLNERLKTVEDKQNRGLSESQSNVATTQAAIRELETQLKGVSNSVNTQIDYTQQMMGLIYSKTFGTPLPATSFRPQLYK